MSLHTARVIPEKRISCPPAAVHFAGVEKGIDMKIERITLENIKDHLDRYMRVWIDVTKEHPTVCLDPYDGRHGGEYAMETIIEAAIKSDDDFIMTDGFDGKQDIRINASEIRKPARNILTVLPVWVGSFNVKVQFEPCDHSAPF